MSNDYLAVFLYRWDDAAGDGEPSSISYGEQRSIRSHYPSTVIGVATRPVGETINHHSTAPEYAPSVYAEFRDHVNTVANDVRWFDKPLECNPDEVPPDLEVFEEKDTRRV